MEISSVTSLSNLPEELTLSIFSFLGKDDLCNLQLVNTAFQKISCDDSLWKTLFCDEIGILLDSGTFWKDIYSTFFVLQQKLKKSQIQKEHFSLLVDDLNQELEHLHSEKENMTRKFSVLTEDLESQLEQKFRIAEDLRTCKEVTELQKREIDEMKIIIDSQEEKLHQLVTRVDELEYKLELEKESKKSYMEYKELWEKENDEVGRLKSDQKKKEKQIEKLEESNREKVKEVARLQEKLDRSSREERLKRVVLERRLETLGTQLSEESSQLKKESEKFSYQKETLKKEAMSEFEHSLELKRRNRELERELRRKSEFFETEIARMKNLVSKSNKINGALSFVMAKA